MKLSLKLLMLILNVAAFSKVSTGTLELKPLNGTAFSEIGKGFAFQCIFDKDTPIIWYNNSIPIARCTSCKLPCKILTDRNPWGKTHVMCDIKNLRSILTLTDLTRLDHTDFVGCQSLFEFVQRNLLVGSYNSALIHPQNTSEVPVLNQSFALVCQLGSYGILHVKWFDEQGKIIAYFIRCYAMHNKITNSKYASPVEGRNITCDNEMRISTLTISTVQMSLDGTSVGCFNQAYGEMYLYKFTVHVPVESVEIQSSNDTESIEGTAATFVCLIGKSKPQPRVEWLINMESTSYRNVTSGSSMYSNASEKFFESRSTLILTLHRSYKTIQCRATVANLPWVESEKLLLDVKPNVKVYIIIGCLLLFLVVAIIAGFLLCQIKWKTQAALKTFQQDY